MIDRGWQAAVPLHNLIPEWNDLIYRGNWKEAYDAISRRRIIFRSLQRECARRCARRPAPADLNGDAG